MVGTSPSKRNMKEECKGSSEKKSRWSRREHAGQTCRKERMNQKVGVQIEKDVNDYEQTASLRRERFAPPSIATDGERGASYY